MTFNGARRFRVVIVGGGVAALEAALALGELAADRVEITLLALGARPTERFKYALTLDFQRLDEQLPGLIQDVEGGYVRKLAFLVPTPAPRPLPIYELALMTARRAWDMNQDASVMVVTPEDTPLAIFGSAVSDGVQRLLEKHGLPIIASAHCETPEPGRVSIRPGARHLHADRVVALPRLLGPSIPGVPRNGPGGFIPIDAHCRVRNLAGVYAAGDATDFAVKHGGIAAQRADTAAESIAALAGAAVRPSEWPGIVEPIGASSKVRQWWRLNSYSSGSAPEAPRLRRARSGRRRSRPSARRIRPAAGRARALADPWRPSMAP